MIQNQLFKAPSSVEASSSKNTTSVSEKQMELTIEKGTIFCTSLQVADCFGKRHSHVTRDISVRIKELLFHSRNAVSIEDYFIESTYSDAYGRNNPCYLLTREGVELLRYSTIVKTNNREAQVRDYYAYLMGFRMEVNTSWGRIDLWDGDKNIYEVKHIRDYKCALGQLFFYNYHLNFKMNVILFGTEIELSKFPIDDIMEVYYAHGVDVIIHTEVEVPEVIARMTDIDQLIPAYQMR